MGYASAYSVCVSFGYWRTPGIRSDGYAFFVVTTKKYERLTTMSEAKVKCPACAEEIANSEKNCPFCGEKINTSTNTESTDTGTSTTACSLYSPKEAALISILLTPIFGAFVIWNNWKALNKQDETKRSQMWLIVLAAVIAITLFTINEFVWIGICLIALAVWYYKECAAQISYIQENNVDFQKKDWKKIVIPAAFIVVCAVVISSFCGTAEGPELDCSGNQAFIESGSAIVEYLKEELEVARLVEKTKFGDNTDDDDKIIEQIRKVQLFLANNRPKYFSKDELDDLDGLSAMELLEYVDENYTLERMYGTLQKKGK